MIRYRNSMLLWSLLLCSGLIHASIQAPKMDADTAYQALITGADYSWQTEGETRYKQFVREVELERQRFRRQGLNFWHGYPNDPRRYSWLILTTHLAPAYPKNLDHWIEEEVRIGANGADVDTTALKQWQKKFTELRKEFWAASEVTQSQRRLLWTGELRQELLRIRNSRERGEKLPDTEMVLDKIMEYLRTFARPAEEDKVGYVSDWNSVLELALGWPDVLRLSDKRIVAFAREMTKIDSEMLSKPAQMIIDQGQYPLKWSWQAGAQQRLAKQFAENELKNWADWRSSGLNNLYYDAVFNEAVTFPGFGSPNGGYERAVLAYGDNVGTGMRLFRENGLAEFDNMSLNSKLTWLAWTTERAPVYRPSYMAMLFDHTAWRKTRLEQSDWKARDASNGEVLNHIHRLLKSGALSPKQAVNLREREINLLHLPASDWWRHFGDRGRVDIVLNLIRDLDLVHGQSKSAAKWASQIANPVGGSTYKMFGLTDTEVKTYFSQFLGEDSGSGPEMRKLAENVLDRTDLEPGVNVAIQAPTLDGNKLMDTADLKGKIVLIDHWATSCAPCIAAMPDIHKIYQQYKGQGFEVVSIVYDGKSAKQRVEDLKKRMGLTWTTLNGEGLWPGISAKYGYKGYPQYMLLDRQGRYVAGSGEMGNGKNLKALLDGLLADEQAGRYQNRKKHAGEWRW